MSSEPSFHHALRFREDICIGCSHCMNICPTEAIRVSHGKACLIDNRCVDCGDCYRVCPVGAIKVEQDDFENIYHYSTRVALIPAIFTGQFPDSVGSSEILAAVLETGFTHVVEVEESVGLLSEQINEYITNHDSGQPLISSFCPAVVRLIQVKFPTLTPNIVRLKAPVSITAMQIRQQLIEEGALPDSIGLFYVTPCAAKIVAVRNPVGEEQSGIDGVINMNYLYNKVFKVLRQRNKNQEPTFRTELSPDSIGWSLTHGEANFIKTGKSLAIDEINNVVEFLEKVENEEIDGIKFLELRACDESCAGGILCTANRFIAAERLRKRAETASLNCETLPVMESPCWSNSNSWIVKSIEIQRINPRSMVKLDDDMSNAMTKMKRIYELNMNLPQVDCGICGSPSCKALAEDIVQHGASLSQCIFIQRILEQNEKLDASESTAIMRTIWSDSKLDKNSLKGEFIDLKNGLS